MTPLPPELVIKFGIQLCQTLSHIHEQGIAHGNLHPEAIIVRPDGQLVIRDLGLAQIFPIHNTTYFHYGSPERILYGAQKPAVDIWSVGAILYEMLTGELPFGERDDSFETVRGRIENATPKSPQLLNPQIPMALSNAVLRAFHPYKGYQSIREMADTLAKIDLEKRDISLWLQRELVNEFEAPTPMLYLLADGEDRAQLFIEEIALRLGSALFIWTVTDGLLELENKERFHIDPLGILRHFRERRGNEPFILVLKDFHPYLSADNVQAELIGLFWQLWRQKSGSIVLLSPILVMPAMLERVVRVFDLPEPDFDELWQLFESTAKQLEADRRPTNDQLAEYALEALGLPLRDIRRTLFLHLQAHQSRVLHDDFVHDLLAAKIEFHRRSNLVELVQPTITLSRDFAGGALLKDQVSMIGRVLKMGRWLPQPRGWLFTGIPGCGKSMAAEAIAGEWNIPLLRFDVGKILGSKLGESETHMYKVLGIAESVAPAVLFIDNIDKALVGVGSGTAGGTMERLYSILLTWLQERSAPIFVIATANPFVLPDQSIVEFAPDFFRAGRIDQIFFFDLPQPDECAGLFEKLALKYGWESEEELALDDIKETARELSGAECDVCFVNAMYHAAAKREWTQRNKYLLEALNEYAPRRMAIHQREHIEQIYRFREDIHALSISHSHTIQGGTNG